MRTCPACKSRLPLLTVLDPTHLLTLLCKRCWATLRLNLFQFSLYSIAGMAIGACVAIAVLLVSSKPWWTGAGLPFYSASLGGMLAGRFFAALEIVDPPLAGGEPPAG